MDWSGVIASERERRLSDLRRSLSQHHVRLDRPRRDARGEQVSASIRKRVKQQMTAAIHLTGEGGLLFILTFVSGNGSYQTTVDRTKNERQLTCQS